MFDGSTTREWSDRRFDRGKAIAAFGGTEEDDWEGFAAEALGLPDRSSLTIDEQVAGEPMWLP